MLPSSMTPSSSATGSKKSLQMEKVDTHTKKKKNEFESRGKGLMIKLMSCTSESIKRKEHHHPKYSPTDGLLQGSQHKGDPPVGGTQKNVVGRTIFGQKHRFFSPFSSPGLQFTRPTSRRTRSKNGGSRPSQTAPPRTPLTSTPSRLCGPR
jgi:hypothetical protein